MKALVYRGRQDVAYAEVPDPVLTEDHQAVVDVTLASICGSDLHIWDGHGFSDDLGFTVGHEAVGIVREVGAAVTDHAPGDRVLVPASVGCSTCGACATGRVSSCASQRGLTSFCYGLSAALPGSQAERLLVPHARRNLMAIPESISDEAALVLTDAAPTAWYGCQRGRISPGDSVVIIGLGPVGLMAVQSALTMGASQVIGIDPIETRRKHAEAFGAETLPASEDARVAVRELVRGPGADVAIDAVGTDETISCALGAVRRRGRVSVIGVSQSKTMPFPMEYAQAKEIEFAIGLCSVQAELPTLLPLAAHGRIHPEQVVSHRFPLSEGTKAYDAFGSRDEGVVKIVLDPTL